MVRHSEGEHFVSSRHSGWNRPSPVKIKKRRPFLKFILLLLVVFSAIYGYIFLLPILTQQPAIEKTTDGINQIIDAHPDYEIGVSLVDIKNSHTVNLGQQSPFTAASTTKLLTAALTMQEVEKGTFTLDDEINDHPISWHLQQMVNQSNNDSWKALNDKLEKKNIEKYAKSIGLNSYNSKENLIAPNDMATLLKKLYGNELMNAENTKTILGFMTNTNEDSFIPAVADTHSIKVYHKYGWFESNIHDVAILTLDESAWAIAIYTHPKNNENNSTTSRDIIHQITEVIVGQLNSKT